MLMRLFRCVRHRWLDAGDVRRCLPPELVNRLESQLASGEMRHKGEVRLCVEAGLPVRSLWRHFWLAESLPGLIRERAWAVFSKLGVWDTEHNNGVLIYLLLAERSIEIVADRGLRGKVSADQWQAIVDKLAQPLAQQQFETGLHDALAEVNALLGAHFARQTGEADTDELSNTLVIL